MNIRRMCRLLIVLIIAIGMTGASAMPASAAVKTPYKVTGLKATQATSTVISISWKASKNSKKYEVQYKQKTAKKWKSVQTTAKKKTFKSLKQNTKYQFRVRGLNGTKKGAFSTTLTQQTYLAPAAVNGKSIFASERTKGRITIQWNAAKNASWYEVTTKKLNASSVDTQDPKATVFESVIQMRPNTWYEFKVRTVNAKTGKFPALKSAWSAPFYACTTRGSRVITGMKAGTCIKYDMNDTFAVGIDEPLIPEGVYRIEDPTEDWYDYDIMTVSGISFPGDFEPSDINDPEVTADLLKGKTFMLGGTFEMGNPLRTYEITGITVSQDVGDGGSVNGYAVELKLKDAPSVRIAW